MVGIGIYIGINLLVLSFWVLVKKSSDPWHLHNHTAEMRIIQNKIILVRGVIDRFLQKNVSNTIHTDYVPLHMYHYSSMNWNSTPWGQKLKSNQPNIIIILNFFVLTQEAWMSHQLWVWIRTLLRIPMIYTCTNPPSIRPKREWTVWPASEDHQKELRH